MPVYRRFPAPVVPGFLALSDDAVPAIEYLFDQLTMGLDIQNLDDQAKLASLAMPHIERVPAGILKQLMLNRVEALTGFSPEQADRTVRVAASSLGQFRSMGLP